MDQIAEILQAAKKSLATESTRAQYRFAVTKDQAYDLICAAYIFNLNSRGNMMLADDVTMKHIDSASKWLSGNHKPGLLLFGGVGNGKTTLANAIADAIDSTNQAIRDWENDPRNMSSFSTQTKCPARQYIAFAKATRVSALEIAKVADSRDPLVLYKKAGFLILDDLGCEPSVVKSYGNEISLVSEILYSRYENLLPTILTTNLDKAGIRDFYGPRIADRLEELCDCIGFNNKSYRK